MLLDIVGSPRKVIGILFAGWREATTIDEGEQPALRMQVGEECDGRLGGTQGSKIFKKTELVDVKLVAMFPTADW